MNESNINILFWPHDYTAMAERFLHTYALTYAIACPVGKMKNLIPKGQRVCRFCGRNAQHTSFKSEAHIIPQLLGNKYFVSDEECDECNKIFMAYENDLANFLARSALQGIHGKTNNYQFKTPDKQVIIRKEDFFGVQDCITVWRENVYDTRYKVNHADETRTIEFVKHSYRPINVFKAILKTALGCLSKEDFSNYTQAVKYLLSDTLDDRVKGAAKIFAYQLPLSHGHREPLAFIYTLKAKAQRLSTHMFVLYFANLIYQIVIPLHKNDLWLYDGSASDIFLCPPLFADSPTAKTITPQDRIFDLESSEMVKGEVEIFVFQVDKEDMKNAVVYNPATGEETSDLSTFGETAKIVLMDQNASFSI